MQIVENLHLCPLGVTKSLGVVGALPFYGDLERGLGHLYGSSTSEAQLKERQCLEEGYKLAHNRPHPNMVAHSSAVSVPPDCITSHELPA